MVAAVHIGDALAASLGVATYSFGRGDGGRGDGGRGDGGRGDGGRGDGGWFTSGRIIVVLPAPVASAYVDQMAMVRVQLAEPCKGPTNFVGPFS